MEFANASADVLAARGIALDEPSSLPSMGEATARTIASGAIGGKDVLEALYVHLRNVSKNPPIDKDCWVLSLDPAGLRSKRGVPADYLFAVVDPESGEVLEIGYGGGGPNGSPGTRDPRLPPA